MKPKRFLLTICVLTLPIILIFSAAGHAQNTVRVGLLLPFTGPLALEGKQTFDGVSLAADIVNDRGGLWGGRKIEFVKGDSVTPEAAMAEMERLITVEKCDVITGGYSSARVFAASEISEKYKKIYWITTAVAENIFTRGFKHIFRWNAYSGQFGQIKTSFTAEQIAPALGKKPSDLKVAIIYEDSLWGTTTADIEKKLAPQKGLKVVVDEAYSAKAVDLSPLIMKLKAAKPDVVLMTGYVNDTHLFWRQCKEMDFDFAAFLENGAVVGHPEWLKAFGKDAEGTMTLAMLPVDPKLLTPKAAALQKDVLERFAKKYNLPQPGALHFTGFESAYLLFNDVLPAAGSLDPEKVRQAALKVNRPWNDSILGVGARFAGPDHPMAGQNLESTNFVQQWQNGKLVAVSARVAAGKLELPMPTWSQRAKMK
jgi:branched-chain amino acid transport system substrate-binding protein